MYNTTVKYSGTEVFGMLKRLIALLGCMFMILSMAACGSDSIATVDGEDIDEEYFKYYFVEWKNMIQRQHGEDTWEDATLEGKPALEYVRERALQSVIEDKIVTMRAKADGINLTEQDVKSIEAFEQQWISQYGSKDAFLEAIMRNYGLSEEQFDYMMEAAHYRNHVIDKYVDVKDAEVENYYEKNIARVKHILIATVDLNTGAPLSEEEVAQAKEEVDYILKQIDEGADFDMLVSEFTEDQDVFYYVGEGYTLAADGTQNSAMVTEFEDASLALDNNEISGAVKSSYGYHIIKRYENDDAMYHIAKDSLTFMLKSEMFNDVINTWKTESKIVVNESMYNSYK